MSSFAALMALSASQTSQAQSTAASLLAEKKKKEDEARRKKEEAERKQRELDAKIRKKRMEEEERERERQERLAKERDAKERERERREKAQLDHLLGQKKRKTFDFPTSERASGGGGGSGGGGSGASRKARADDELDSGAMALTRAEKRERKAMLEMRREFGIPKRAGSSASYGKAGRRLPGGAIDATSDASGSSGSGSAQLSARARLTAMPNTLTKLNVNKRDTRTIDEILQDRAKLRGEVKVLDGEDARDFNDWFGGKKKREPAKSEPTSKPASPAPGASSSASKSTLPVISKKASTASLPPKTNGSKPSFGAKSNRPSTTSTSKAKPVSSKSSLKPPPSLARGTSPKRRRSQSYDSLDEDEYDSEDDLFDDPPPKKRRAEAGDEGSIDISREIWGMFRMNRDKYVSRDVLSDDEDMEVGAMEVEKEEKRSGKLARQEDLEAEEEERRHMEEKKRRKKERDRRGD